MTGVENLMERLAAVKGMRDSNDLKKVIERIYLLSIRIFLAQLLKGVGLKTLPRGLGDVLMT